MKAIGVLLALALTGCAAVYEPPPPGAPVGRDLVGSKSAIFDATKLSLVSQGWQVVDSDPTLGTISTLPRTLPLTEQEADCGSAGLCQYILGSRVKTTVAISATVARGEANLLATVDGDLDDRPSACGRPLKLICTSTGALESRLLDDIAGRL